MDITLKVKRELFKVESHTELCELGSQLLDQTGIDAMNSVWIDAEGTVARNTINLEECVYPITVYELTGTPYTLSNHNLSKNT